MKISQWFCENRSVILVKSECDFGKVGVWFCENQPVMWWKSASDFVKIGVWFWQSRSMILWKSECDFESIKFYQILYHKSCYIHYLIQYLLFFYLGLNHNHISLRGYEKMIWDRTAIILLTRWHETGLHSFLWQDCMRQDCIHFVTRLYETGLHPFLWQDCMRQDCFHFYDKTA